MSKVVESAHTKQIKVCPASPRSISRRRKMKRCAGLISLFILGAVVAIEEPNSPLQPQDYDAEPLATVCVQVRGRQPICGPAVNSPDGGGKLELASRSSQQFMSPGMARAGQFPMSDPSLRNSQVSLNSQVHEDFYRGAPVYSLQPSRAADQERQMNLGQGLPIMPMIRNAAQPPVDPNSPCNEPNKVSHPRFMNVGRQGNFYNDPPQILSPFASRTAELRTFPFAPFGIEQQPQQAPMRQPQPFLRPPLLQQMMMRNADNDCVEDLPQLKNSPENLMASTLKTAVGSPMVKGAQSPEELSKLCEQHEKEIREKSEEIAELKKKIARMTETAKSAVLTSSEIVSEKSSKIDEEQVTTQQPQQPEIEAKMSKAAAEALNKEAKKKKK